MFSLEIVQQLNFQFISGREVGMAAFASEGMMTKSIPIHAGYSESSACGDDGAIAFGIVGAFTQGDEVFGF